MQFMDDSLLPENQDPLVIQVAPYAPSFLPRDSDDIPVSMAEQVQKAVIELTGVTGSSVRDSESGHT